MYWLHHDISLLSPLLSPFTLGRDKTENKTFIWFSLFEFFSPTEFVEIFSISALVLQWSWSTVSVGVVSISFPPWDPAFWESSKSKFLHICHCYNFHPNQLIRRGKSLFYHCSGWSVSVLFLWWEYRHRCNIWSTHSPVYKKLEIILRWLFLFYVHVLYCYIYRVSHVD